jgi:hypothetical protein
VTQVALVFLGALHASALRPSDATAAALRRCAWPRAVAMPNVRPGKRYHIIYSYNIYHLEYKKLKNHLEYITMKKKIYN